MQHRFIFMEKILDDLNGGDLFQLCDDFKCEDEEWDDYKNDLSTCDLYFIAIGEIKKRRWSLEDFFEVYGIHINDLIAATNFKQIWEEKTKKVKKRDVDSFVKIFKEIEEDYFLEDDLMALDD